jgi:hypothetical protein
MLSRLSSRETPWAMTLCNFCLSILKNLFKSDKYEHDEFEDDESTIKKRREFSHLPHMQDLPSAARYYRLCALMTVTIESEGLVDWEFGDKSLKPVTLTAYAGTKFLLDSRTLQLNGLVVGPHFIGLAVYAVEGMCPTVTGGIIKRIYCSSNIQEALPQSLEMYLADHPYKTSVCVKGSLLSGLGYTIVLRTTKNAGRPSQAV